MLPKQCPVPRLIGTPLEGAGTLAATRDLRKVYTRDRNGDTVPDRSGDEGNLPKVHIDSCFFFLVAC